MFDKKWTEMTKKEKIEVAAGLAAGFVVGMAIANIAIQGLEEALALLIK